MTVTISLLGMYQYDKTILDGFRVPEGMDRDATINNLLLETSELEFLYPDINTCKFAIGAWTDKEFRVWQKLWETVNIEYNPLYSSYREEHRSHDSNRDNTANEKLTSDNTQTTNSTENITGKDIDTHSNLQAINIQLDNTTTRNLKGTSNTTADSNGETKLVKEETREGTKDTTTDSNDSQTRDDMPTGYDEYLPTLRDRILTTDTKHGTANETTSETTNGTDTGTSTDHSVTDTETSDTGTITDKGGQTGTVNDTFNGEVDKTQDSRGNINVTGNTNSNKNGLANEKLKEDTWFEMKGSGENNTPQNLLTQEWEFRQLSVYDYILNSFKKRFCLLVY